MYKHSFLKELNTLDSESDIKILNFVAITHNLFAFSHFVPYIHPFGAELLNPSDIIKEELWMFSRVDKNYYYFFHIFGWQFFWIGLCDNRPHYDRSMK